MISSLQRTKTLELKTVKIHDVFFQTLVKMYDSEAKGACEKLLLSIKDLANKGDYRVKLVEELLGVGEAGPTPVYMIVYYVLLTVATGFHIDEIFGEKGESKLGLKESTKMIAKVVETRVRPEHILLAKKSLIVHSAVYVNGEQKNEITERDKLRNFYAFDLQEGVLAGRKTSIAGVFADYSQGKKKINNSQMSRLIEDNSATHLDPQSVKEAVELLFPEMRNETYEASFAEVERQFYWKIRFEVPLRTCFQVGAEIVRKVAHEAEAKLRRIYSDCSKDQSNRLRYAEYVEMMAAHKKITKWEVFAIYDEIKSKDDTVLFDDFFFHILFNPTLKNFFD